MQVSFKDVRNFFKSADLDVAEAALEIAGEEVGKRHETRKKMVAAAAKARAGKGAAKGAGPAKVAAKRAERPASASAEHAGPVNVAEATA